MWDLLQISFGTASFVALVYAVWPNIMHRDVKYRRQAVAATVCFLVLTAGIYLWSPGSGLARQTLQTGTMEISNRRDDVLEVFYAKPFRTPPNLNVRFTKGSGEIELVEQRADGFRFKTRTVSYISVEGAHIEWLATGAPTQ